MTHNNKGQKTYRDKWPKGQKTYKVKRPTRSENLQEKKTYKNEWHKWRKTYKDKKNLQDKWATDLQVPTGPIDKRSTSKINL